MELNLERPLLFFDIESTGLNIASDSIIELCFVKIMPGGEQRVKTWRVKPWDYAFDCQRAINPSAQAFLLRLDSYSTQPMPDELAEKYGIHQIFGWNDSVIDYMKYVTERNI